MIQEATRIKLRGRRCGPTKIALATTAVDCRYPSDLTEAEWAHVEPLIPPAKRGGNRRHVNEREVVNGSAIAMEVAQSHLRGRRITRIRLSDKTSRLRPRHVVPKPAQTYELDPRGLNFA
jgi:hypothetical protein